MLAKLKQLFKSVFATRNVPDEVYQPPVVEQPAPPPAPVKKTKPAAMTAKPKTAEPKKPRQTKKQWSVAEPAPKGKQSTKK